MLINRTTTIHSGIQPTYIFVKNKIISMNFIVSSASLLKQLSLIQGVLNSSNTLPILDNFLFEIKDTQLKVSASDLETTMSSKLPVESKEDGLVAIPAKMLIDILKNLSDHPIKFSVDKGNFQIEISSKLVNIN